MFLIVYSGTIGKSLMASRKTPGDSTDFLIPTINNTGSFAVGSIADYFGIPTGVNNLEVNALPFRAYNLIYNEWFRDENLQDSLPVEKGDGPDDVSDYKLVRRGKRHDYFTSALPWPQKGPGVEIPLGTSAPIVGISNGSLTNLLTTTATNLGSYSLNEGANTYAFGSVGQASVGKSFFV